MTLPKTLLIVAALVMVIVYLMFRLQGKSNQLDSANSALTEKEATIREFRTAQGKTATEKVTAEVSKSDLKDHYPEVAKQLKDLEIRVSQLKGVLTATIEAKGKGEVIIVRDTIRVTGAVPVILDSVKINDGYLRFKGQAKDRMFGYSYTYQDSITFVFSEKKIWLFGRRLTYGTGILQIANARITNLSSILIKQPSKRWNISAGIGYDFFERKAVPTVYCGYSIIKF